MKKGELAFNKVGGLLLLIFALFLILLVMFFMRDKLKDIGNALLEVVRR